MLHCAYLDQMIDVRINAHEQLSKKSFDAIHANFKRLEEDTIPAKDKLKLLSKTRELSRNIEDAGKDRTFPIYDQINAWEEKLIKLEWRERYVQAIAAGTPNVFDEIEREMGYIKKSWEYIDLDARDVRKKYLTLHLAKTTESFNKAKENHRNGDLKQAFSNIRSVYNNVKYLDFTEIGHDPREMLDFHKDILKLKIKQDFDKAIATKNPSMESVFELEEIERTLLNHNLSWDDMEPHLTAQSALDGMRPIFVQAALEQWQIYQSFPNHSHLNFAAECLNKAKAGWDALGIPQKEAAALVEQNRHRLPSLDNI